MWEKIKRFFGFGNRETVFREADFPLDREIVGIDPHAIEIAEHVRRTGKAAVGSFDKLGNFIITEIDNTEGK
jgi:hypothetical protein